MATSPPSAHQLRRLIDLPAREPRANGPESAPDERFGVIRSLHIRHDICRPDDHEERDELAQVRVVARLASQRNLLGEQTSQHRRREQRHLLGVIRVRILGPLVLLEHLVGHLAFHGGGRHRRLGVRVVHFVACRGENATRIGVRHQGEDVVRRDSEKWVVEACGRHCR